MDLQSHLDVYCITEISKYWIEKPETAYEIE